MQSDEDVDVDSDADSSEKKPKNCPKPSARQHYCKQCNYGSDRKCNFTRHMEKMHSMLGKTLICCGHTYTTKADHKAHVKRIHGGGYVCSQCNKVFPRKALLERHLSTHNGVKKFSCGACEYKSSNKSNLHRHSNNIHSKKETKKVSDSPSVATPKDNGQSSRWTNHLENTNRPNYVFRPRPIIDKHNANFSRHHLVKNAATLVNDKHCYKNCNRCSNLPMYQEDVTPSQSLSSNRHRHFHSFGSDPRDQDPFQRLFNRFHQPSLRVNSYDNTNTLHSLNLHPQPPVVRDPSEHWPCHVYQPFSTLVTDRFQHTSMNIPVIRHDCQISLSTNRLNYPEQHSVKTRKISDFTSIRNLIRKD